MLLEQYTTVGRERQLAKRMSHNLTRELTPLPQQANSPLTKTTQSDQLRGGGGGVDDVTMAKPESRADVRLEAFSLARLRYSFLQESACRECSFRLIVLRPPRALSEAERAEMTSLVRTHVQQHRRPAAWPSRTNATRRGQLAQLRKPPRVFLVSHSPSRLTRRVCRAWCTAAAAPYTTHNAVRRRKNSSACRRFSGLLFSYTLPHVDKFVRLETRPPPPLIFSNVDFYCLVFESLSTPRPPTWRRSCPACRHRLRLD